MVNGIDTGVFAILGAFVGLVIIIMLALYVYFALVLMTIAKKLGYDKPWLAWIPVANVFLYPILAKKHWAWGFIFLAPIVNMVFMIIWSWIIYERRKYPGWLALIPILGVIPVLGIAAVIAHLVIIGLVAWKDR